VIGRAEFSPDGVFRYTLERRWGRARVTHTCMFVMLNPSTADADKLDPTVNRCLRYAQHWGYTRLYVGNVFALRSTDPRALLTDPDPTGNPENDTALRWMVRRSNLVVVAWGTRVSRTRAQEVLSIIQSAGRTPHALRVTKDGAPGHPLYLPKTLEPEPYNGL
jgi:hypothetical protein